MSKSEPCFEIIARAFSESQSIDNSIWTQRVNNMNNSIGTQRVNQRHNNRHQKRATSGDNSKRGERVKPGLFQHEAKASHS